MRQKETEPRRNSESLNTISSTRGRSELGTSNVSSLNSSRVGVANWKTRPSNERVGGRTQVAQSWRTGSGGHDQNVLLQIPTATTACEFVPHLAGKDVTVRIMCTARGPAAAGRAAKYYSRAARQKMANACRDTGLWMGHRLLCSTAPVSRCMTPPNCNPFRQTRRTAADAVSHGALAGGSSILAAACLQKSDHCAPANA